LSLIRKENEVLGLAVFLRDLTRQLELLRDMAQAQKMAALESVAGAVAHHFNNILGGAITTADFALASDDPDLHKRTLGITITALSRASEVTHGLLAFAEGEHTDTVMVDVRHTIQRYVAGLESTLQSRHIQLDVDLQPTSLTLPPKALTTVLDRLIANAVEAMPSGGVLTVQLQPLANNQLSLRIADTGPGISEQIRPRMFEPFFTTKQPERARPSSHMGLGLAVVHGIIKDLGGTVTVTSAPDAGTTFIICVPATPPSDKP
jgi:signal transduction histidine kinase